MLRLQYAALGDSMERIGRRSIDEHRAATRDCRPSAGRGRPAPYRIPAFSSARSRSTATSSVAPTLGTAGRRFPASSSVSVRARDHRHL